MRNYLIIFLLIIILIGCYSNAESNISLNTLEVLPTVADNSKMSNMNVKKISDYKVYVSKQLELSLYEPIDSCYLGAYVLSNRNINFDMQTYDNMTEKKHSTYIYNIRLGEPFPIQWILECISQMKTPHIVVYEPNNYDPLDYSLLEETAKNFGEFYTPMFIEFYPNPQKYRQDSVDYVNFYRAARNIFKEHASNAAFVWSIDINEVHDSYIYYPGDEYTDWIGINIYEPIFKNNVKYDNDFYTSLNYFYYMYQSKKPIMISQLAISHYSNKNHTYYNKQAASKLFNLYNSVRQDYNRIKAINYMDVNNILLSPKESIRDNFSVTNDGLMLNAYKDAVADNYFLEDIQIVNSNEKNFELLKSAFDVYTDDSDIYISKKTFQYELEGFDILKLKGNEVIINDEEYYKLTVLESIGKLNIEKDKSKILISVQA